MTDDGSSDHSRSPAASRITLSQIMRPTDTNLLGTVHGGVIMKIVDDAAGTAAARYSGGAAVTVAMDEMSFLVPVHVGDLVHTEAQVNWAGHSSMEVGVRVFAERWDEVGERTRVATAYLVFVAVDSAGQPRQVPPLALETEAEHRRFKEAGIRRASRLARRDAIRTSREPDPETPAG